MIRYAVIASVCAIMTGEDSCFNLTSKSMYALSYDFLSDIFMQALSIILW